MGLPRGAAAYFRAKDRAAAAKAKAERIESEARRILDHLASMPNIATSTTVRDVARHILLSSGGWIMAQGHSWNVVAKSIGAGVYQISLKERHHITQGG